MIVVLTVFDYHLLVENKDSRAVFLGLFFESHKREMGKERSKQVILSADFEALCAVVVKNTSLFKGALFKGLALWAEAPLCPGLSAGPMYLYLNARDCHLVFLIGSFLRLGCPNCCPGLIVLSFEFFARCPSSDRESTDEPLNK